MKLLPRRRDRRASAAARDLADAIDADDAAVDEQLDELRETAAAAERRLRLLEHRVAIARRRG